MSNMWTVIEIKHPRRKLESIEADWLEAVEFFEPDVEIGEHSLTISESSKYQNDSAIGYAFDYTEKYPKATVTITEEWTGDGGPSTEVSVIREGARVREEGKQDMLVPNNLRELLQKLEKALSIRGRDSARLGHIEPAATALLKALS